MKKKSFKMDKNENPEHNAHVDRVKKSIQDAYTKALERRKAMKQAAQEKANKSGEK